ncbi:hypothetical protein ES319_A02G016600v1 [Gossypium barbadense]|uniref:DC1 domain-containing protein n=1 Tax=Gossypium barbadense TaxID=3634 RepID=A0A5J5WK67_GOSBA|nr:hypothetical protein ES319_A02G016600v1 [Gossypium barbadense]
MVESNNYGHQHPLLLILNQDQLIHNQSVVTDCSRCGEKVSAPCFCCAEHCGFYLHKEPLTNYTHFSPDCGFNLHEKCAELPFKQNLVCHPKHPLVLQFNSQRLSCKICRVTRRSMESGFVYGCSPCKFVVHIECASQSALQLIKSTNHEHPFTLFNGHQHPLLLMLNQEQLIDNQSGVTDCSRCGEKVSAPSFYCAEYCGFYLHKCAMKDTDSYEIVENEDEMPNESSISVIERNDAGEATKIKHFKHMHNLMLGPFVGGYENSCNGCMLPISDPFYYCSECVFSFIKRVPS